jgi:hypothetical protein
MSIASRRLRSLLSRSASALLAALALAAGARADELRLHDGRVLVGKVAEKGDSLEVTTRDGVIVVAKAEVLERLDDNALRTRLAKQARDAGDGAFASLQLAILARESGLEPEMWRHLDRAVAQRDEPGVADGLKRRLRDFLAQLEPEVLPRRFRGAATKVRVHQLLDGVHAVTTPGHAAAIEELLVQEQSADQDLRNEARRNGSTRQRITALAALQRRQLAGNDRFVLRTAILDGSEQVREAAVDLSRNTVRAEDVEYMAAGLSHANAKVRVRTADALGGLGRPEAVKWLVMAGPNANAGLAGGAGNGDRGHVAILTQTSYIRDYDVEVAQAAMIADPKVDVLQSGSVLDVTVVGTIEERVILRSYRQAIQRLTQRDPGEDARKWAGWYASLGGNGSKPAPTTGG